MASSSSVELVAASGACSTNRDIYMPLAAAGHPKSLQFGYVVEVNVILG